MSIWYLLVNEDKKEFIDSMDYNMSGKYQSYVLYVTQLLGYLTLSQFDGINVDSQYDPSDTTFTFEGHWTNDNVYLEMEQNPLYDMLHEKDKKGWINISIPVAKEWNELVNEWFEYNPTEEDKTWVRTHTIEYK
jgi:hypothetical protein